MSTHPADESAKTDPSPETVSAAPADSSQPASSADPTPSDVTADSVVKPATTTNPATAATGEVVPADADSVAEPPATGDATETAGEGANNADNADNTASVDNTANTDDTLKVETAGHGSQSASDQQEPAEAGAADTAGAAGAAKSEQASQETEKASSAEAPAPGLQVGSRRGDKKSRPKGSRPQTPHEKKNPQASSGPKGPVPVPSKRGLSDDLEQEVQAALAGQSLDDLLESPAAASETGEGLEMETRVTGQVENIHGDNVFITLGGRNQGVASVRQFAEPPEVGTSVEVVVSGMNREDGLYEVVVPGAAISVDDWNDLSEGAVVEARITGSNTGGLECKVNNIRGFIPASQISIYRVENFAEFVDQKFTCVVTEANPKRKNLVLSRRAILEREREAEREKLMAELAVGQEHEGTVRNIRDFGAFVDLGGVDGLIHISQLSWDRVNHPSDVVKEGEKVKVRIEKIDPESGKIGLSYRSLQEHPWADVEEKFPVGSTVSGTVSRLANFGAFVKLATGVEGLVHVSELAHHRVSLVKSIVSEGDTVNVKVLSVDKENQRIGLSIKQTSEAPVASKSKKKDEEEIERERALPKREGPLKGGVDKPSGGDQFGLKW